MADAQNNQKNQQQDLNQILKVRREKLAALQEVGKAVSYTHLTPPTTIRV